MNSSYKCVEVIKSCRDIFQLKQVHAQIIEGGFHRNRFVGNILIQMYGKHGHAEEAELVMSSLEEPNVFSYNILIRAFAVNGHFHKAKSTFDEATTRNCASWNTLMSVYTQTDVESALYIYQKMPAWQSISCNTMLSCLAQHGLVQQAKCFFDDLHAREDISWTSLLNACENSGQAIQAHEVFTKMPLHSLVSCTMIIRAYALQGHVEEAGGIFNTTPLHDIVVCNVMISSYGQAGSLRDMKQVFDRTPQHDIISWTAVIVAYAANGELDQAKCLFDRIPAKSVVTSNVIITAFARNKQVHRAEVAFAAAHEKDLVSWNSLLEAYSRSEHHHVQAREFFERLSCWDISSFNLFLASNDHSCGDMWRVFNLLPCHDWLSWSTLVCSYAHKGHLMSSLELLQKMPMWSSTSISTVSEACATTPDPASAKWIFDANPERDLFSWTALIAADAAAGDPVSAENTLERMPAWDAVPFTAVIDSWASHSHSTGLHRACSIFESMPEHTVVSLTAMLAANARHGQLSQARKLFNQVPIAERDTAMWNAMIGACGEDSSEALDLLRKMSSAGCPADDITFISVLSSCSTSGLVAESRSCFHSMVGDHSLAPVRDHYCCVIDSLSKAGDLAAAQELIESMPFVAERISWMTLIAACRTHNDPYRADSVACRAVQFFPGCSSIYSVLASFDRDYFPGD